MACTKKSISAWFQVYQELLQKLNITSPAQIFNCDKSSFPFQVKNSMKVCVDRHTRINFQRVSANKDSITTFECIMCYNGSMLPPSVRFQGKTAILNMHISCRVMGFLAFLQSDG